MLLLVGCAALIGPTHREAQVAIAVVAFLLGGCGWLLGTFAGGSRLLDIWRRRR